MDIRLENVSKRFGRAVAVDRLTLKVEAGELMVLLGPSGCGKSTSLRLVAGLEELSEGEIYIGERCVNSVPAQDRDVAMVFQNYALYPHMTVAENIGYPLRVRKRGKDDITREVRQVAAKLGLEGLLERRPRQLSGGQQQRVALARAIIRQPVAFLLDEPLSNLDANLRLQMRAELKGLQRELGTTMLYVTHDHAEAMTLAHRIAVLRDGTLQQVGTPMELYRRPANRFVAGFLGTPPMNFLSGSVQEGVFHFEGGSVPLSGKHLAVCEGIERLVLGFRPQDASLSPAGGAGTFTGSVYVTEEMGSESYVVLSCGGHWITVESGAGLRPAPGEKLAVAVPAAAVHLFEAASGGVLVSGEG